MRYGSVALRVSIVCILISLAQSASAATVRGRLYYTVPNRSRVPAPGVAVTISFPNGTRSAPAHSDGYGMYYIYNIPPGKYRLEVWTAPGHPPLVFTIQVREPYTDVSPIVV